MLLSIVIDFFVLVLDCVFVDNCLEFCKELIDSFWYLLFDDSDIELLVLFFLDEFVNEI